MIGFSHTGEDRSLQADAKFSIVGRWRKRILLIEVVWQGRPSLGENMEQSPSVCFLTDPYRLSCPFRCPAWAHRIRKKTTEKQANSAFKVQSTRGLIPQLQEGWPQALPLSHLLRTKTWGLGFYTFLSSLLFIFPDTFYQQSVLSAYLKWSPMRFYLYPLPSLQTMSLRTFSFL